MPNAFIYGQNCLCRTINILFVVQFELLDLVLYCVPYKDVCEIDLVRRVAVLWCALGLLSKRVSLGVNCET